MLAISVHEQKKTCDRQGSLEYIGFVSVNEHSKRNITVHLANIVAGQFDGFTEIPQG